MFGFDEGEFGAEEGGEMVCAGYGVEDLGLVDGVGGGGVPFGRR